jgi:nucleotide-binding universal stress UspA family protein
MLNQALAADRRAGQLGARARPRHDVPTIVCGIDDSGHARAAARIADELATRLGARLVLVHVVSASPPVGGRASAPPAFPSMPELERAARAAGRSLLVEVAEQIGRPTTATRVESGPVALRLEQAADEEAADLLVVGTRGTGDVHAAFLGSVSGALLRSARCPVLVVPPAAAEAPERALRGERVVCAVRDDRDLPAVELAATLAELLILDLTLAHVLPPGLGGTTVAGPVVLHPDGPAMTPARLAMRQLQQLLDSLLADHPRLRDRCRLRLRRGRPAQQLDALCEEEHAVLIVLGPQRRGPLRVAVLGSVARDLARHGTLPIVGCPRARYAEAAVQHELGPA